MTSNTPNIIAKIFDAMFVIESKGYYTHFAKHSGKNYYYICRIAKPITDHYGEVLYDSLMKRGPLTNNIDLLALMDDLERLNISLNPYTREEQ